MAARPHSRKTQEIKKNKIKVQLKKWGSEELCGGGCIPSLPCKDIIHNKIYRLSYIHYTIDKIYKYSPSKIELFFNNTLHSSPVYFIVCHPAPCRIRGFIMNSWLLCVHTVYTQAGRSTHSVAPQSTQYILQLAMLFATYRENRSIIQLRIV